MTKQMELSVTFQLALCLKYDTQSDIFVNNYYRSTMVFHGMIIALSKFDFLSIGQLLYQTILLIIRRNLTPLPDIFSN